MRFISDRRLKRALYVTAFSFLDSKITHAESKGSISRIRKCEPGKRARSKFETIQHPRVSISRCMSNSSFQLSPLQPTPLSIPLSPAFFEFQTQQSNSATVPTSSHTPIPPQNSNWFHCQFLQLYWTSPSVPRLFPLSSNPSSTEWQHPHMK